MTRDEGIKEKFPIALQGRKEILQGLDLAIREQFKEKASPAGMVQITGPKGVGRTRIVQETKLRAAQQGGRVYSFSALKGPLWEQIYSPLKENYPEVRTGSWEDLLTAWMSFLQGEEGGVLIILEELHQLPEGGWDEISLWLSGLLEFSENLLVLLEFNSEISAFDLPEIGENRNKTFILTNLSEKETASWFKAVVPKSKFSKKLSKALYEKTEGNPLALSYPSYCLSQIKSNKGESHLADGVVKNTEEWVQGVIQSFTPIKKNLVEILAIHPTWVSQKLLSDVMGIPFSKLNEELEPLVSWGWILKDEEEIVSWYLHSEEMEKLLLKSLKPEEIGQIHRKIYDYLNRGEVLGTQLKWLAYHGEGAGLSADAFRWNLLAGENSMAMGGLEAASDFFRQGAILAETDFKKAYALGLLAQVQFQLGRWESAIQLGKDALRFSLLVDWEEFIHAHNYFIAQALSHLGNYSEAETYQRAYLGSLKTGSREFHEGLKGLGILYLEEAKYREALETFQQCHLWSKKDGDPFEQAMIHICFAQVYSGLGMTQEVEKSLKEAVGLLGADKVLGVKPFLKLLQGKFEFIQGHIVQALRILEEAAHDFDKMGDVSGKVETLLSMSAPMLEYNLVGEAQRVLDLLSGLRNLQEFPALMHSVGLRRLALSAFSGKLTPQDLQLLSNDETARGRTEDWLQLWFHLALASQKLKSQDFFELFITKSKDLAQVIAERLPDEQKAKFFLRPDVARVIRLAKGGREEGQVKAVRTFPEKGPAEAATLAPPIATKKSKEPKK